MAIIDEYKQAIQDVLDGRAPEPPKPSEFPDTDDKLAAQYFAAAARALSAGPNMFEVTLPTYGTADKTYDEIVAAYESGKIVVLKNAGAYYYLSSVASTEVAFAKIINGGSQISTVGISSSNSVNYGNLKVLPSATSADNGSELIVKSGSWAKQKKKFLVTLTPTSPDYSGTMDKTVAEINAAYEAGQEIWFKFSVAGAGDYFAHVFNVFDAGIDYPSFNTYLVLPTPYNIILFVATGTTSDGISQTYSTDIYSLTPAS